MCCQINDIIIGWISHFYSIVADCHFLQRAIKMIIRHRFVDAARHAEGCLKFHTVVMMLDDRYLSLFL